MRKAILPMFSTLVFFLSSNAQFRKGTIMLGTAIGTTGYSSSNSDYGYDGGSARSTATNTFTLSFGPQMGVFLTHHLVMGATPSLNLSTSHVSTTNTSGAGAQTGSTSTTTTTTVAIGPFIRDYFAKVGPNNWFYMQVNGSVASGSGSSSGNSYSVGSTATTNGKVSNILNWNAGGSVGLTHFFYERIGMDVALGYLYSHAHNYNVNNTYTTNKSTGIISQSTNNYTLGTGTNGVTFGVGFHWFMKG
ncbi:MAG TPA: hypothetical protein VNV85_04050 [Puia sp.]|jgi:hypothetical protein|nr:hypothetical protein [Puia sp.]